MSWEHTRSTAIADGSAQVDVDAALDRAGVTNDRVRAYVRQWAAHTRPDRVEVVSAADDDRLIEESLAAGEIQPAGQGLYYSRSYAKDTARSEERTIVATSNPADRGVYNNWRPASEMTPLLEERMRAYFDLVRDTLRELRAQGRLRSVDPTVAAFGLIGTILWLPRWFRQNGRLSQEQVARQIADIALGGLLRDGAGKKSARPRAARRMPRGSRKVKQR